MSPPSIDLDRWAANISAASRRALGDLATRPLTVPEAIAFADEGGNRTRLARWLLARRTGQTANTQVAGVPVGLTLPEPRSGDEQLWHALVTGQSGDAVDAVLATGKDGPLVGKLYDTTIEVFTEQQLAAMHALWALHVRDGRPDWLERLWSASRWMLDFIQPDNATNHPWALHVFVLADSHGVTRDGCMYADTLLHNCQVTQGCADKVSAHVLADAALALSNFAAPA